MRLFITGGSGLLGSALVPMARERGYEVVAPRSIEFDITDPGAVARLASGELGSFDWVLNLAAYTKVDLAETNREEATGLNAVAPGYLASACEAVSFQHRLRL
jgi:dTDP-4-dehydrorhamnose reductase